MIGIFRIIHAAHGFQNTESCFGISCNQKSTWLQHGQRKRVLLTVNIFQNPCEQNRKNDQIISNSTWFQWIGLMNGIRGNIECISFFDNISFTIYSVSGTTSQNDLKFHFSMPVAWIDTSWRSIVFINKFRNWKGLIGMIQFFHRCHGRCSILHKFPPMNSYIKIISKGWDYFYIILMQILLLNNLKWTIT